MTLKDKVIIYHEYNLLIDKYAQESSDPFGMEYEVGDEVMTIIGEKYGLTREEIEDNYFAVDTIFMERAINQVHANSNSITELKD